jgi:hypothetical protein
MTLYICITAGIIEGIIMTGGSMKYANMNAAGQIKICVLTGRTMRWGVE